MRNVPSLNRFCHRRNLKGCCHVSGWFLQLSQFNFILIQRIFVSFPLFFWSSKSSSKFKIGCRQHWWNGHGRCWIIHCPVILCMKDKLMLFTRKFFHAKPTWWMLSEIDFELGQLPGCKSEWVSHSNEKQKKNNVKKVVKCKMDHIFRDEICQPIPKAGDVLWHHQRNSLF